VTGVAWPNPASPGLRPFHVEVPPDWTAVEPPGGLIAFLGPEFEGFRPNVVVSGRRTAQEVALAEIAAAALREGGATVDAANDRDHPSGDRLPTAVRTGSTRTDGLVIRQVAVATEAEDWSPAGVRSVYTLVGTYLADHSAVDEPLVMETISSFQLGE